MNRSIAFFVVLGALSSLGGCVPAETAQGEMEGTEDASDEETGTASSAITGAHKICSVIVGGNWRDTLVVPSTWTSSRCNSFRASIGGSEFQLGCIHSSGYSWGAPGGWLPPNNVCGW